MLQTLEEDTLLQMGFRFMLASISKTAANSTLCFFRSLQVLKACDTFHGKMSVLNIILFFTETKILPEQQIQNTNSM